MDLGFDNNIELMLNTFILIAVLCLCNITIVFLGNNSENWGVKRSERFRDKGKECFHLLLNGSEKKLFVLLPIYWNTQNTCTNIHNRFIKKVNQIYTIDKFG